VAFNENPLNGTFNVISNPVKPAPCPAGPACIPADPGIGWKKLMTGYDYTAQINKEGLPFNPRYGLAQVYQTARNLRLAVRFIF
jgi:hypothetical protein